MNMRLRRTVSLRRWIVPTLSALAALTACSPALNWRDVRPEGVVALQFPCRPDRMERSVALAGAPMRLALLRCDAAGLSWAFAQGDVGDPARVEAALQALREAALANVDATASAPLPLRLPGATGLAIQGRLPDGQPVHMRVAIFAHGTHVHQATVFGPQLTAEAAVIFFDSLRVVR